MRDISTCLFLLTILKSSEQFTRTYKTNNFGLVENTSRPRLRIRLDSNDLYSLER